MPGTILYDFGHLVRSSTCYKGEEEKKLSDIKVEIKLFRALSYGYLASAGNFLTRDEKEYLVFASKLYTWETGLRFLIDYLEGDLYFKISHSKQNLERARTQFKLFNSITAQEKKMMKIIIEK